MKAILSIHPSLEVRTAPGKGRGVFALQLIEAGTVLERAPVITFSSEERHLVEQTFLYHYVFDWGHQGHSGAIALGFGSLYNHDHNPNAYYVRCEKEGLLLFIARRNVFADEEITVNYNGDPTCQDPVWFSASPVAEICNTHYASVNGYGQN